MIKYFEKNVISDKTDDFEDVDNLLWKAFQTLSHNVETKLAMPYIRRKYVEGREAEFDRNLAGSTLMMVATCEAPLSKLDPEIVEAEREDVKMRLAKDPRSELGDLLRAALGID